MNKILSLLDRDFVVKYLEEKLLPIYPQIERISEVSIKTYKKMVWSETYHVVIGFDIRAIGRNEEEIWLPVVCSAHSNEPREVAYKCMRYLWDNGFGNDDFLIPRPLFFDPHFNANFYRALEGDNLLRFIKDGQMDTVKDLVGKSAHLFARLHDLPQRDSFEFNPDNAMIRTVIPGVEHSVREVRERYGNELSDRIARLYSIFIDEEEARRPSIELSIIHGDAHMENVIHAGAHKVGLIDFTDFSLSDRFRDVGTFLQQLGHKIRAKAQDEVSPKEFKYVFLNTYLEAAGLSLDGEVQARINLYYNWTSLRTVIFWLLKYEPTPEKAIEMLGYLEKNIESPDFRAQD